MAGQAPHPPWFRMYFPSTCALAPPPPPPPTRPPPPTPTITQTSIPIKQKMEESVPLPPAQVAPPSSAPAAQPKPPVSPPATSASPPRLPVATFPTSTSTPLLLSPLTSTYPKTTKTQVAASEALKVKVISRPTSSPKVESLSPQSPKTKQPLFNPITLPPPAQINKTDGEKSMNEEKNVPEQHNHDIVSAGKRELTAKHEGLSDSEDDWMRVIITLAGENKGVVMELVPSNNKNHLVGNPQSRENGEEISKSSYKDEDNTEIRMTSQGASFLNSNIQGLNNSVLCDCT